MGIARYAELHCHTNFSFGDGASHPEDLVERAVELGYVALACTDHNGFYGAARFASAARGLPLGTIYGVEVFFALSEEKRRAAPRTSAQMWRTSAQPLPRRGRIRRSHGAKDAPRFPPREHILLLARSPAGYRALSLLVTKAQRRGEKDAPEYTREDLAEAAATREVLALTGCWQGAAPRAAAAGDLGSAMSAVARLREVFGPDGIAIEMWHHAQPGDDVRNDVLWEVSGRLAIPAVATNNVHYHRREDAIVADVLAAISGRAPLDGIDGRLPGNDERCLKSPAEQAARFARYPGVVERAAEYGRELAFDLCLLAPRLPDFPLPSGVGTEMAELRRLTWEGAREVYANDPASEIVPGMRGKIVAAVLGPHPDPSAPTPFRSPVPKAHPESGELPLAYDVWPPSRHERRRADFVRADPDAGPAPLPPSTGTDLYEPPPGTLLPGVRERLRHELGVIEALGFPGYFLIVWDLVRFSRENDIYCQIRGSGADAAICRCLGLTRVDAVRLGLPFERFLSADRGRPPDIDIDFEAERREEVIQYCYARYGRERAAMVANVITYRARNVLRDVGKAFGLTQAQVDGLSKYVDTYDPTRLAQDVDLPPGLDASLVFDVCARLDGFPRHLGIHSGGMVIADRPLHEVVPVEWGRMEGRTVLQWDKDDCASVGIVKFDLLGLGMLNALHLAVDLIADVHGTQVDLATIRQEPEVYDMLTRADTVGLFQVESRAQMATLPRMRPTTFYDLAIEVALIRPGPIQGHSVHPFLRRRNGQEGVRYPHPSAKPVLEKTLGVPVFQEQLMELARVCAGFSPDQTDRLRAAMTHKRSEKAMARLAEEVYAGMAGNGITGAAADEIWEKLQGFASFGFPESHSVSFAYIVYSSAWLRLHYPAEFLAGLLNAQPMGFYSPNTLVSDARRHGVITLPPSINRSGYDCTIETLDGTHPHHERRDAPPGLGAGPGQHTAPPENPQCRPMPNECEDGVPSHAVRLGLRYVRGMGESEIARVEAAREAAGPFESVADLGWRTGLGHRAHEGLAASGALDELGTTRREALWAAGALAELGPDRLPFAVGVQAPLLLPMEATEEAGADLWSTGVAWRHPMEFHRADLHAAGIHPIATLLADHTLTDRRARVAGLVTHRQRPGTAAGIIFLNLEDETGLLNVIVYPDVWAAQRDVARRSAGLVIEGVVQHAEGVTSLLAHRFTRLAPRTTGGVPVRNFR